MNIYRSSEDYLEMILRLQQTRGYARSIDIAEGLSVTRPSVSVAMRNLRENGYITMDAGGAIHLTETGRAIAVRIFERHTLLTCLLIRLGVEEKVAEADACKIEHDLSPQTFEAIKRAFGTAFGIFPRRADAPGDSMVFTATVEPSVSTRESAE